MYLTITDELKKRADELKQLALNGSGNTDQMNQTELCYYTTMMYLYKMYYAGQISLETAQRDGQNALRLFRDESQYDKFNHHFVEIWKKAEQAGTAYAHNRTRENADELYRVVYGFREGSNPFNSEAPEWEKDN